MTIITNQVACLFFLFLSKWDLFFQLLRVQRERESAKGEVF